MKSMFISSFETREYVVGNPAETPLDLDVFFATNGWYAVTLEGTYSEEEAERALSDLKAGGRIPADSFQTYGNTYRRKICCE